MWLDRGIDSGGIIATERPHLSGTESLAELQERVLGHGVDLYSRCIERLSAGDVEGIPQSDIGAGRTFYSREWGATPMLRAITNHRWRYRPEALSRQSRGVTQPLLVSLPPVGRAGPRSQRVGRG